MSSFRGIRSGRVHELLADTKDAASAVAFASMLVVQSADKPLLWLRTVAAMRRGGQLYGPGLADLGLDPNRLLIGLLPDDASLLRAAGDAARCGALGVLVVECWGNPRALDLTATRRLTLAAERSGVTVLLLRLDAAEAPGAVETRWRATSAPSRALLANAPGQPTLGLELLRQRGGPAGALMTLEWRRDERRFAAPDTGALVPLVRERALDALPRQASG